MREKTSKLIRTKHLAVAVIATTILCLTEDMVLTFGQDGSPGTCFSTFTDDNQGRSGDPYNQGKNDEGYYFSYDAFCNYSCFSGPWNACYVCDEGTMIATDGGDYDEGSVSKISNGNCGANDNVAMSINSYDALPAGGTFRVTNTLKLSRNAANVAAKVCDSNAAERIYGVFDYQTPPAPPPPPPGAVGE